MRSGSDTGIKLGQTGCTETEDQKCDTGDRQNSGKLFIVGIGPGSSDHLTGRAINVLKESEVICGYGTYIDLIKDIIEDKPVISTGMTKEVARVQAAIDTALSGKSCSIVSSGDPGVYAMAGLVFEMCEKQGIKIFRPDNNDLSDEIKSITIEVVPGIPALASCASLLGAPLTHDFAVISLSDLLTKWEKIEERIEAAAKSDFVIVIYNPKSKKRNWQLGKAIEIISKYRDGKTPAGVVSSAMRDRQNIEIVKLDDLADSDVGMQTTVIIGSTTSVKYMDYMITPRGYSGKYEFTNSK